jgi:predicted molibdopterin-dependent oxidoreductase YjgC
MKVLAMPGDPNSNGTFHHLDDAAAGAAVRIFLDGQEVRARAGQTVAAALLACGRKVFRRTAERDEPRGLFCGMGICFDCVMEIDGRPNVRACQTLVRDGMRVSIQQGHGSWEAGS